MVLVLPKVESFGEQFGKQLGQGMGQGVSSAPNLLMDLLKMRNERESSLGNTLIQQTLQQADQTGRPVPIEEQMRMLDLAKGIAGKGGTPLDLQKEAMKQLAKNQNERAMIEQNIAPENIWEDIKGLFTGEDRAARSKKRERLSSQLQKSPYYDTEKAAMLTKKLGYEAAQDIIAPLNKEEKSFLKQFPKLQRVHGYQPEPLSPEKLDKVRNFMRDVYSKNPSANPISLRKNLEEKGVNWKDFLSVYEELEQEGLVQLPDNPNYADMKNHLYKPPMSVLKKMLHNAKLVER